MADFLIKQPGSNKTFHVDGLRPMRKDLPDEAIRARLQEMQSAGFTHARNALNSKLLHRTKQEKSDAWVTRQATQEADH